MALNLYTILSRSNDMLHAPGGADQAVMMSVRAGMYYGLNAVGSRVWDLLESPQTIGQLCTQLCQEFDVDAETCRLQILNFAGELLGQGVVHADLA